MSIFIFAPFDKEKEFNTSNCRIIFDDSDLIILLLLFSFSDGFNIKGVTGSNNIISSSFKEAFWPFSILEIYSNPDCSFWLQHYIYYIIFIYINNIKTLKLRLLHPFLFFGNFKNAI